MHWHAIVLKVHTSEIINLLTLSSWDGGCFSGVCFGRLVGPVLCFCFLWWSGSLDSISEAITTRIRKVVLILVGRLQFLIIIAEYSIYGIWGSVDSACGSWSMGRGFRSGSLVVSGMASDHKCFCALEIGLTQSQDLLKRNSTAMVLTGYGYFKETWVSLSLMQSQL